MAGILVLAALVAGTGCTPGSLISWGSAWSGTVASDDVVYVGTRHGEIWALHTNEDGSLRGEDQLKWRFAPEGGLRVGGVFGMPAVGQARIYVGDTAKDGKGGRLWALRKERDSTPELLREEEGGEWVKPLVQGAIGPIVGGPALARAEGLVIFGSDDHNLYALDAETGKNGWTFPTDEAVWSSPAVKDGAVYFGSMDRHVYALSLEGGVEVWRYKTGGAVVTKPLLLDDMVIVGSFDKKLYALSSETGDFLWSFEGDDWFWASPVSSGDTIVAASMKGTVYGLDKDGNPIWPVPFEAQSPIVSALVIVGDKVVVGTDQGRLHVLSVDTGETLEVLKDLGGRVKAPLSTNGTMVFVGVEDGTVRGIDVDGWKQVWIYPPRE